MSNGNNLVLGGLFVVSLIAIISIGYTYMLSQELSSMKMDLANTQQELNEANSMIQTLSDQPSSNNELNDNKIGSLPSLQLKGEVVGPITNTKIEDNVIDSSNIVDHSIGKEDIDSSEIQVRIDDECPEGYYVKNIDEDGHLVCGRPSSSGSSGGVNSLTLEEVLSTGNDAKSKDIKNVDELSANTVRTDVLCINNECRSNWTISGSSSSGSGPSSSTPGLGEVLAVSGNGRGKNITQVNSISTNELCIKGDCATKMPYKYINYYIKSVSSGGSTTNQYKFSGDYDICAVSGILKNGNSPICKVKFESGKWTIYYRDSVCEVICFNIEIRKS